MYLRKKAYVLHSQNLKCHLSRSRQYLSLHHEGRHPRAIELTAVCSSRGNNTSRNERTTIIGRAFFETGKL
jgi:hypothetical protein